MKTLVLDGTTISIQVAMSTSAATTNPTFVASFADNSGSGITEGATDGALNGSTDVTVVAAPTGVNRRVIKDITIFNGDTAAVTVIIKYDNNATQRTLVKVTLAVGDTYTTDGTFDANGNLKQITTSGGDVLGPASATSNNLAAFDGTTGKLIKQANTVTVAQGGTGATTLAGANIAVVNVANTFTATQTFSGTSSTTAIVLNDTAEVATISATAATGTINYDITTQSVLYYTSNASANWTVNFRASSGTSLNTLMSTGQSMTVAFLVTQGSTAYYNSAVTVDSVSVTPKYQGGTAYAAGNASSVDVYMYTIIKTGNAAFTVFTSQTKFA
jgi:hypothetical protein